MLRPAFERLVIWRAAMRLAKAACRLTEQFTKDKAGLGGTIAKLAAGLPARIADASERDDAALAKAANDGRGNLREILSYLALAQELGCISRWRTVGLRMKIHFLDRRLEALHEELTAPEEDDGELTESLRGPGWLRLRRAA